MTLIFWASRGCKVDYVHKLCGVYRLICFEPRIDIGVDCRLDIAIKSLADALSVVDHASE